MPTAATDLTAAGGSNQHALPGLATITGPSPGRATLPRRIIAVTGSTVPTPLLWRHINTVFRQYPEVVARHGMRSVACAVIQVLESRIATSGQVPLDTSAEEPAMCEWLGRVGLEIVPDSQPFQKADGVRIGSTGLLRARPDGEEGRLIGSMTGCDAAPLSPTHRQAAPTLAKTPIPEQLAQQTGQMMRTVNAALGDAPLLYRWKIVEGKVALMHVIPGWDMQTVLEPKQTLSWWGYPDTVDALQDELRQVGIEAVFLANVLTGLCLRESQVTIALDELVRIVGRGDEARRSHGHRLRVEREVWRAVRIFDALTIVGRHLGRYKTRDTKEVLDVALPAAEALIKITRVVPGQLSSDGSAPPAYFSYVCGPWIEAVRGDRRLMTDFGNVMRLAAIPSGQPSGAWAKSIGLNLNQRWREWAHEAQVRHVGDVNRLTVRFAKAFTRRDLLLGESLYRASPDVEGIFKSRNPARARKFWDGAISILKESGVDLIGHCAPIEPARTGRQGWQDEWLDQPFDIRPTQQSMRDVAELAQANAQATRRRARQSQGKGKSA